MDAAREVADRAFAGAAANDEDGAFPAADVIALHAAGLLTAPLPVNLGGRALGTVALCATLRHICAGSWLAALLKR